MNKINNVQDKVIECNFCSQKFSCTKNRTRHMKKFHSKATASIETNNFEENIQNIDEEDKAKDKNTINNPRKCDTCGLSYSHSSSFSRHMQNCEKKTLDVSMDLTSALEEIKKLREENQNLKEKLNETEAKLAEALNRMSEAHNKLYGKAICLSDENNFNRKFDNLKRRCRKLRHKKLYEKMYKIVRKNQFDCDKVYSFIDNWKSKKTGCNLKGSTKMAYLKVAQRIIRLVEPDAYIQKPLENLRKNKIKLGHLDMRNFLSFLWHYVDLNFSPKNLRFYVWALGLASYGCRGTEFSEITRDKIRLDPILINKKECKIYIISIKDKQKAQKDIKITEEYYDVLKFIIDNNENKEATIFGDSKSFQKLMWRKMKEFFGEKVGKEWAAVGMHSLRKHIFNNAVVEDVIAELEKLCNFSHHKTYHTLEFYKDAKVIFYPVAEENLKFISLLGKKRPRDPNEIDPKLKKEHFEISKRYFKSNFQKLKEQNICCECFLPVVKNFTSCSSCDNKFHTKCETRFDNLCKYCYYITAEGHKLTELLPKTNCTVCGSKDKICEKCFDECRKLYDCEDLELKETVKLKNPKVSQNNIDIGKKSLHSALNAKKLVLCNDYVYIDCENNVSEALLSIETSKGNAKIIESDYFPSVEVKYDEQMGYVVVATEDIPKNTFICKYLGDVYKHTEARANNDSQLTLLDCGIKQNNLVICPEYHANLGRFLSGCKDKKKCNVEVKTVEINGKLTVIMFANRLIKKGQLLYWNYGPDYPMEDFTYKEYLN